MRALLLCTVASLFPFLPLWAEGGDAGAWLTPGDRFHRLTHGGVQRGFLLHLPSLPRVARSRPMPLVVALHCGLGNCFIHALRTGFSKKADAEGFAVAYPRGTGLTGRRYLRWNGGYMGGVALDRAVDDVGFIRGVIEKTCEVVAVDRKRIYVSGMGEGGTLAHRVGAELSAHVAAVACVDGSIGGRTSPSAPLFALPRPAQPVSVIAFHGKKNPWIPFLGGQGTARLAPESWHLPVAEAVSFWVRHNQCSSRVTRERLQGGAVIRRTYGGGRGGSAVVLYALEEGKGDWPGARSLHLSEVPEPGGGLRATDAIWNFFKAHPKP